MVVMSVALAFAGIGNGHNGHTGHFGHRGHIGHIGHIGNLPVAIHQFVIMSKKVIDSACGIVIPRTAPEMHI